jgi:hypothetical protein
MYQKGLLVIDECYQVVGRLGGDLNQPKSIVFLVKEIETNMTKVIKIYTPEEQN